MERASRIGGVRFTPYASAEFFYDWAKGPWNEEQYAAGIEWPYKHVLKLSTYYLYQDCTTCNPRQVNVAGAQALVHQGFVGSGEGGVLQELLAISRAAPDAPGAVLRVGFENSRGMICCPGWQEVRITPPVNAIAQAIVRLFVSMSR